MKISGSLKPSASGHRGNSSRTERPWTLNDVGLQAGGEGPEDLVLRVRPHVLHDCRIGFLCVAAHHSKYRVRFHT